MTLAGTGAWFSDMSVSGVSKACNYEPELNPTYADMASHYGCAVVPARGDFFFPSRRTSSTR